MEQSDCGFYRSVPFTGHLSPALRDNRSNRAINWVAINPVGVHA